MNSVRIRSKTLVAALVIAAMCTSTSSPEDGEPGRQLAIEIHAAQQVVLVGDAPALFEAHVVVCEGGQADGFVDLSFFTAGTDLHLVPVFGKPTSDGLRVILVVAEDVESPSLSDVFVATVRHDPTEPECGLWDFVGSTALGGPLSERFTFEAAGTTTPVDVPCGRADLWVDANTKPLRPDNGQLLIESPPQTVQVGDDDVLFAAHMSSCPSHRGEGGVQAGNYFYSHAYTMIYSEPDAGNVPRLVALVLLVLESDEPATLDDIAVAVVRQTVEPECSLWIFDGSTVQGGPIEFDAAGTFDFVRGCDPVSRLRK